jgi:hypothetical protein
MATLIIKSNAGTVTDVLIPDVGVLIPSGGGQDTFIEIDELFEFQESQDLRTLITDNAFGAGSSTLILNDGTSDIDQADALNFLDTLVLPDNAEDFGVVKNNADGEVEDNITLNGTATITGLPLPVNPSDAASKEYVDANVQGLDPKESVRALADSNVVLTGTQTIDGVSLAAGERVLLTGQTTPSENGIWLVQAGAWTRPSDFETGDTVAGAFTFVEEGTTYGDTGWLCTSDQGADVVDTDPLTFTQFSSAGVIVAGDGLTKTGNTLDVGAGPGIIVNANDVEVDYGELADIQPLGSTNAPGTLDEAARADHVHAHGDRGGDGTVSQHDADQIDVEGTYTNIGGPDTAETVFSNIEDNFANSQYVGKQIVLGVSKRVPGNGTRFLSLAGDVPSSAVGQRVLRAGTITGASVQVESADATNDYNLSIRVNGTQVATLALASGNTGAQTVALSQSFVAGDRISAALVRTAGSGSSDFRNAVAVIEYNEAL